MSHHFDYPTDETLDISDAYCFAGAGDAHGPRTVFGMNTSPFGAPAWNAAGLYELKIDINGDYVEDITYRATFPIGSDGTQYVQVEQLTGNAATDRTASGTIITPRTPPSESPSNASTASRSSPESASTRSTTSSPSPWPRRRRSRREHSPTSTHCGRPPTRS